MENLGNNTINIANININNCDKLYSDFRYRV